MLNVGIRFRNIYVISQYRLTITISAIVCRGLHYGTSIVFRQLIRMNPATGPDIFRIYRSSLRFPEAEPGASGAGVSRFSFLVSHVMKVEAHTHRSQPSCSPTPWSLVLARTDSTQITDGLWIPIAIDRSMQLCTYQSSIGMTPSRNDLCPSLYFCLSCSLVSLSFAGT